MSLYDQADDHMMLTLKSLPVRNLKGYAGRTAALLLFSALTAASVFGGTMMIGSVRGGLNTVKARLGADIMVTPESAKNEFDTQTVLLKAEPGYFYMDAGVLEEIAATEGVELASPQLFLASAKAGCCSARLQMIAFDPATNFTIQPWIKDTRVSKEPDLMDVIIGSNVSWTSATTDNVIRFYDTECNVIGQFSPTGSTLDSAVYMNFDTCRALIKGAVLAVFALVAGPAVSGRYLAKMIGWTDGSGNLTYPGLIIQVLLPVLIYVGYIILAKLVIPKVISYFRETSQKRRIPRIIGLHVFCVGTIIALCCARLIPEHDGFRINSILIPVTAYGLWLGISRYYEGGWWFKGWDVWSKEWWGSKWGSPVQVED